MKYFKEKQKILRLEKRKVYLYDNSKKYLCNFNPLAMEEIYL